MFLLEAKDQNLKIIATDLDLIFIQNISNIEIAEEGKQQPHVQLCMILLGNLVTKKKLILILLMKIKFICCLINHHLI